MVGIDLRFQQRNLITTMKNEGILDNRFDEVVGLRKEDNPRFVVITISLFTNDAEICIAEIQRCLNGAVIEFAKVNTYAHKLIGNSASIGGQRLALACRDLRTASNDTDRDRCFETFDKVKDEFLILKNSFNDIAEIEKTLMSYRLRNDGNASQGVE